MILRCRLDHTAADPPVALSFARPVAVIETSVGAEVGDVLDSVELAARRGWHAVGFVSYEAAPAFDPAFAVAEAAQLPLAWFGLFEGADPAPPLDPGGPPLDPRGPPLDPGGSVSCGWRCRADAESYAASVGAVRQRLAAGDAYLVNLTTRFEQRWGETDDSFALYRRLVSGYGAGYHAYIETEEWAVACGSPELFFELDDGRLITRPMKGTAPRGRWAAEDDAVAAALEASAKERAENVMVVDMLRNDLGRIAVPGSVTVPALVELERHPSMWQLTSSVGATVAPGTGLAAVFTALFPCASVTGAPKVSAMSIIAGLERGPRGVYCGAVGYIAPGGRRSRFAVAIRTAVVDKRAGRAEYGAGGGISWDSDPAGEWKEVGLKAQALTTPTAPASRVLGRDEGLIETMRYQPGDGIRNLGLHLERLAASARYFGIGVPDDLRSGLDAIGGFGGPMRVRLVLTGAGCVRIEVSPLDPVPDRVLALGLDGDPVRSCDPGLFHKTTRRQRYELRAGRHPDVDDVVLVNERGEITETTRANIVVRVGGRWCTPPLDCGLLPGVERGRLLDCGHLSERVITMAEFEQAREVATVSSLRGWRPARLAR